MTRFEGCGTALVTPFAPDGRLDLRAYRQLIQWQIDCGIDFLVPCGTTGESVTLKEEEYREVIRTCVETVSGKVAVLAGAGTNDTSHAAHLARLAAAEGADGILSVTPYYNKPTQDGLFRHFQTIAEAVDVPVVLYNVPTRTSCNLLPETAHRLSQVARIVGIKEASGDLVQIMQVLAGRPDGFSVLSGDDAYGLGVVALGGEGLISVLSNAIPAEMTRLMALARQGRLEEARHLHYRYLNLMRLIFIETNPIPIKYVLFRMGRIQEEYRLPMCPLTTASKQKLDLELARLELATTRV